MAMKYLITYENGYFFFEDENGIKFCVPEKEATLYVDGIAYLSGLPNTASTRLGAGTAEPVDETVAPSG